MLSNGRKTPNPVLFDYEPNVPTWIIIVRNVLDILIILAIATVFVLIGIWVFGVAIPGMW